MKFTRLDRVFSAKTMIFLALLSTTTTHAVTANYYKCTNRVGGEWNYGRAPSACNANAFGEDRVVRDTFGVAIFDDKSSRSRSLERDRYMQEVYSIIRDSAAYYIKKRKPSVSDAELKAWTLAIMTTAAHESYASHYRIASDGKIKMMRGDVGHGHGLMQIDDRSHFPAITNGTAWNLITNLTYGMDIFYSAWQNAPSKSCVGSATQYEARTRAAWSAYNGGPSQLCRWTKKTGTWAQNDKNFYNSLKNKDWLDFVAVPTASASINVSCLIEKRENCPATPDPAPSGLVEGALYQIPSGAYCSLQAGTLHCVADSRDTVCLHSVTPLNSDRVQTLTPALIASVPQVVEDRHELCSRYDSTLLRVGQLLQMQKNINVRNTPGGGLVGVVLVNDVAEILDFELRGYPVSDRYYKIRMGSTVGYIYAGTQQNTLTWVKRSDKAQSAPSSLAQVGDRVRVINSVGINLRTAPNATILSRVPVDTVVTVLALLVQGSENKIYYKISYGGRTGYIYSGTLLPTDTINQWTLRLREI